MPRGYPLAIRASLPLRKCDLTILECWKGFDFRRRERWRTPHRTSYGQCPLILHHSPLVQSHLRQQQQPKADMDRFVGAFPEVDANGANRIQILQRGLRFWNK